MCVCVYVGCTSGGLVACAITFISRQPLSGTNYEKEQLNNSFIIVVLLAYVIMGILIFIM